MISKLETVDFIVFSSFHKDDYDLFNDLPIRFLFSF